MPADYARLRADNIRRYGEDIGRFGRMLLAHRYDNRAHFIFELLQNAEDALRRNTSPKKQREVSFTLHPDALVVSHFGEPFTVDDVQYICGIGESSDAHQHRLTDIGRFGIGFKSVYAFTDRPEIHSEAEHFAIEDYVRPSAIPSIPTEPRQTVFRFPFRTNDAAAYREIAEGLSRLELSSLIFLREIGQIGWQADDGTGGTYLRETRPVADHAREVTIIGQARASPEVQDATYLVFDREVMNQSQVAGRVEIAYRLRSDRIDPIESAKLSVFFPTIVHTQFGAILQGPFRTTPSRDNIPRDEPWNKHLVSELAILTKDSIRQLRDLGKLDSQALHALPIHRQRFVSESLFAPLFEAVLQALSTEPLIPCLDGQHRPASEVRLGRTREIRDLFSPPQLGALYSSPTPLAWVTDGVSRDRTPQLREYLNSELKILESEADAILSRLTQPFLAVQPLEWLVRLYEFLGRQEAAWRTSGLTSKPIIRLQDGRHVVPFHGNEPQAYLPSTAATDFPTVHVELCRSESATDFLRKIGLGYPDVVDDVIKNLLPRFQTDAYQPTDSAYSSDLARIQVAFNTDSADKKKRLLESLRGTPFVFATEPASGRRRRVLPPTAYIPTDRLKALFTGISGVWLADMGAGGQPYDTQRDFLRACGVNEYLLPVSIPNRFNPEQLREMRRTAGCEAITREVAITDYTLRDLDKLMAYLPTLAPPDFSRRAALLWESLAEVESNRGKTFFSGVYRWFYWSAKSHTFPAAFVEQLRSTPWAPRSDGTPALPAEVVFESLSPPWEPNPFLLSLIAFKPRAAVALAQLVGLEPDLIDLLKAQGITSKKQLADLLGLPASPPESSSGTPSNTPTSAIASLLGDAPGPTAPVGDSTEERAPGAGRQSGTHSVGGSGSSGSHSGTGGHAGPSHPNPGSYRPAFHTYVAADPDDELADPEGLDQAARMQIEQVAIDYILSHEATLHTTPPGNPGFDLYEGTDLAHATRYVEVKSRSGPWSGPVALSREQFLKAQSEGDRFWLYVVEHTRDPAATRLHRIQNPAGKSLHFTFDPGWSALANPSPEAGMI